MLSNTAFSQCAINNGIGRSKKQHQGGIDKLYIFPFVKLNRSSIYTDGVYLESFPITEIYEFDVVGKSFKESSNLDAAGVYWDQDISFNIPITTPSSEVYKLVKSDYRAIILDRLGNYRILGLYNGMEAEVTNDSGTEKSSLNGYSVKLKGKEENQAYFLNDLSLFREQQVENYIFQDGCNFIFEDGTNYIFN